jgi:hypothetical protein
MEESAPSPRLATLERLLDSERQLLETLLLKLTQARLLLAANEVRFVSASLQEVQMAMDDIREAEDARVQALTALADELGKLPSEITLEFLATQGPAATRARFRDLRYRFMDLTKEIEKASAENKRLAQAGLDAIRGTLSMLYDVAEDGGTYDRRGRVQSGPRNPLRLDRPL